MKIISFSVLTVFLPLLCSAQFYAGARWGGPQLEFAPYEIEGQGAKTQTLFTAQGFGLDVGYRFNRWITLEVGYLRQSLLDPVQFTWNKQVYVGYYSLRIKSTIFTISKAKTNAHINVLVGSVGMAHPRSLPPAGATMFTAEEVTGTSNSTLLYGIINSEGEEPRKWPGRLEFGIEGELKLHSRFYFHANAIYVMGLSTLKQNQVVARNNDTGEVKYASLSSRGSTLSLQLGIRYYFSALK